MPTWQDEIEPGKLHTLDAAERLKAICAPSASSSDALLFDEPFVSEGPGYPLLLYHSGLCRPLEVFSEVMELVQFALLGGKQFLKQIPASAPGIC